MKIGFIGLGVMGREIAGHFLEAGHDLYLYNRTAKSADSLVAKGATYLSSPQLVAESSDVIFTMVGYPSDVESVYFGDTGLFSAAISGKILVDMTTSTPSLAKSISEQAKNLGASSLDAPVSGGDIGAKNGQLTIMVGGEQATFDQVKAIFDLVGKTVTYTGEAGSGQHTKMANQIGIAGTMTALTELLVYAKATSLNLETTLEVLGGGGANTWSLQNYGPRILASDYSPGFFVKHFIKDLKIALDEARTRRIDLPATNLALQLYDRLADKGLENEGTQALIKLWWDYD